MAKLGYTPPNKGLGLRKTQIKQVMVPAHTRAMPARKDPNAAKIDPNTPQATSQNCPVCGMGVPSVYTSEGHGH
jgi:hypothetical protein